MKAEWTRTRSHICGAGLVGVAEETTDWDFVTVREEGGCS
jgi:hypothetical protein